MQDVLLQRLIRLTGKPVFLPFFHTVSNRYLPHIRPLYAYYSTPDFETALDYFLQNFEPVEMSELPEHARKRNVRQPVFHLSFDDGLRQCADVIAPVLLRKGIPATFFINPAFAGNNDIFFRFKAALLLQSISTSREAENTAPQFLRGYGITKSSEIRQFLLSVNYTGRHLLDELAAICGVDFNDFLQKERPYMSEIQIVELQNKGFTIGIHSTDHPQFSEIDLPAQQQQVKQSIDWLDNCCKPVLRAFAFPFTDAGVSPVFFEWLARQVDISVGTAGLKDDVYPFHFQRVPMEDYQQPPQKTLRTLYCNYLVKKTIGRHIVRHTR